MVHLSGVGRFWLVLVGFGWFRPVSACFGRCEWPQPASPRVQQRTIRANAMRCSRQLGGPKQHKTGQHLGVACEPNSDASSGDANCFPIEFCLGLGARFALVCIGTSNRWLCDPSSMPPFECKTTHHRSPTMPQVPLALPLPLPLPSHRRQSSQANLVVGRP